ncbi:hypothetical protein ABK040_007063 [Willaertia magna]
MNFPNSLQAGNNLLFSVNEQQRQEDEKLYAALHTYYDIAEGDHVIREVTPKIINANNNTTTTTASNSNTKTSATTSSSNTKKANITTTTSTTSATATSKKEDVVQPPKQNNINEESQKDGYSNDQEALFIQLHKEKKASDKEYYKNQKNIFTPLRPGKTLPSDHPFYYSDHIDISNNELDPKKRKERFRVILHGSKSKKILPFFLRNNDTLTMWTSSFRMGNPFSDVRLQLIELGFFNQLLNLMTHSYVHKAKEEGFVNEGNAIDPLLNQSKDFQHGDHSFYPTYSAEIISHFLLQGNEQIVSAIYEKYFSSGQLTNCGENVHLIDDGKLTIMDGLAICCKVLKYGWISTKYQVGNVISFLLNRTDLYKDEYSLLGRPKFNLLEYFLEAYEKCTLEGYVEEIQSDEGAHQVDIIKRNRSEEEAIEYGPRYLGMVKEVFARNINLLVYFPKNAFSWKRYLEAGVCCTWKENDKKYDYNRVIPILLNLIENTTLEIAYFNSNARENLLCTLSILLSPSGFEKEISFIDYHLIEFIDDNCKVEQLFNTFYQLREDKLYNNKKYLLTRVAKELPKYHPEIMPEQDEIFTAITTLITCEMLALDCIAWLSHNPSIVSKLVQYKNGWIINVLLNIMKGIPQTETEKTLGDSSFIYCEKYRNGEDLFYYSLHTQSAASLILMNIQNFIPNLSSTIDSDKKFRERFMKHATAFKDKINTTFAQSKKLIDWKNAIVAYQTLLRLFPDYYEDSDAQKQKAIVLSNIGEMYIRLKDYFKAKIYLQESLNYDANNDKTIRRMNRINLELVD